MINLELGLGSVHASAAGHGGGSSSRKELPPIMQQAAALSSLLAAAPTSPSTQSSCVLVKLGLDPCIDMMNSHHFHTTASSNHVSLDQLLGSPLPPGWEQCLDLKSGDVFYKNLSTGATTHMDPRTPALEKNGDVYRHFGASQSHTTLIRTNVEAAGANQVSDRDHLKVVFGTTVQQQKFYFQGDVDLDLRLSSFLHVKNSTFSSQSSSTSSHDSSMLVKSCSSLSCISDATMPGPPSNKVMGDVMTVDMQHHSGSCSSSSSPSATSYQCQANGKSEEDDTMNGDVDINTFDANDGASMKMITAACSCCLMFVLLSPTKEPMRCPLCGSHANPLKDL